MHLRPVSFSALNGSLPPDCFGDFQSISIEQVAKRPVSWHGGSLKFCLSTSAHYYCKLIEFYDGLAVCVAVAAGKARFPKMHGQLRIDGFVLYFASFGQFQSQNTSIPGISFRVVLAVNSTREKREN